MTNSVSDTLLAAYARGSFNDSDMRELRAVENSGGNAGRIIAAELMALRQAGKTANADRLFAIIRGNTADHACHVAAGELRDKVRWLAARLEESGRYNQARDDIGDEVVAQMAATILAAILTQNLPRPMTGEQIVEMAARVARDLAAQVCQPPKGLEKFERDTAKSAAEMKSDAARGMRW